jgi:hypothetical protein
MTGTNFLNCGFVMIGDYLPGTERNLPRHRQCLTNQQTTPNLAGGYRYRQIISDTEVGIVAPKGMAPGQYPIYLIGADGQTAVSPVFFTVNEVS